ncbi:unnamed protein product [Closterium sp. NIES-53]
MRLQECNFVIKHRPGKNMQHVDRLSRNPAPGSPMACLVAMAREIDLEGAKKGKERGPEDVWADREVLEWVQGRTGEGAVAEQDTDFSKQAALKDLSPYYLLLGREPILLIDAPKLLSDTVIVGSEERWVVVAEAQAKYLRELLPAALENLHMAQLRDVQRYRQRGAEKGEKGNRVIQARGEVYLKQARKDLLDIGLTTARWRVKEVKDSGVIVLVSEKGEERREHTTNVAAV